MGRKVSTIDLLPVSARQQLQELLRDKKLTLEDATIRVNAILQELRTAGDPEALDEACPDEVSKSSVHRYAQRMEEVGEKLRKSRELSEMWIGKLGAAPQGDLGKLINEILRTVAFEVSMFTAEGDLNKKTASQTAKMVNTLALSMQRLEKAANLNTAREKEIRQQAMEDVGKELEKKVAGDGKQIPKETMAYIKEVIYGLS